MSVYEVTFQMSWSPFILEIELSVLGDPVYASTIRNDTIRSRRHGDTDTSLQAVVTGQVSDDVRQ